MRKLLKRLFHRQTACEKLIEGYKDLTFEECNYIFDIMGQPDK
jgi:hypothetical protein